MIYTHIFFHDGDVNVSKIEAASIGKAEEIAARHRHRDSFDPDDPNWSLVEGDWFVNPDWKPSTAMPPNLPGPAGPKPNPRRS